MLRIACCVGAVVDLQVRECASWWPRGRVQHAEASEVGRLTHRLSYTRMNIRAFVYIRASIRAVYVCIRHVLVLRALIRMFRVLAY